MDTKEFLEKVVTTPEGHFVLATYDGTSWREQWYDWPGSLDEIVDTSTQIKCDCYFSSYLFDEPKSTKNHVLPSCTIQADLDNADIITVELGPSVLVQTSRQRHQGYWILDDCLNLETHERLSKKITYGIQDCDRSGWAIGRKVRLPGTLNCKYGDSQQVVIVNNTNKIYTRSELELGFAAEITYDNTVEDDDDDFLTNPERNFDIGPQQFLENIRDNLPPIIVAQYNAVAEDRSKALWALECALFRAGLNKYEVYYLASRSANNKFASLKINAARELAKDVLRAQRAGTTVDPKDAVNALRTLKLSKSERNAVIYDNVLKLMQVRGLFAASKDTMGWYVYNGRPISLTRGSSALSAHLNNIYGLNPTEPETKYVASSLVSYADKLPQVATLGALAHYDTETNNMYLHTGRRQVLRISQNGIRHILNGSEGPIFPWQPSVEPFVPIESDIDWAQTLFGDSLNDVIGLTSNQALVLMKVWFLFILFRNAARARPLLTILGQPGSGKSAMLARTFVVFYGSDKNIGGISEKSDFDAQTSNFPFVVFDNVDTWEGWLPDRLAQVINNTDIDRRKLFTDNEIYSIKRQAMVALTAHDPKFGRADVVDRLLIISLTRIPEFRDEASMWRTTLEKRNYIWGAIIDDLLTVVRLPRFIDNSLQFRIQDFATIGVWISRALGIEDIFRSAIQSIKIEQKSFILENEVMLVDAINRAIARGKVTDQWINIGDLWQEFELFAHDPLAFKSRYKNATILSRKLQTLQDALNSVFEVKWRDIDNTRQWYIGRRI